MLQYNKRPIQGKPDLRSADDVTDAERAVAIIAARYGLKPHVARTVCALARIGPSDDRPASGCRVK